MDKLKSTAWSSPATTIFFSTLPYPTYWHMSVYSPGFSVKLYLPVPLVVVPLVVPLILIEAYGRGFPLSSVTRPDILPANENRETGRNDSRTASFLIIGVVQRK